MIISEINSLERPERVRLAAAARIGLVVAMAGLLFAGSMPAEAREAGTTVRVFRLNYISVKEASAAVEPLLSDEGSITLQPRKSRISIQDRPEIVRQVAERIEIIDRKPSSYVLQVELLEGLRGELPAALQAEVNPRMRRMFPFDSYRRISLTNFDSELGAPVEAELGEGYHLSFVAASLGLTADSPYHIPNPEKRMELRTLVLEKTIKGRENPLEILRIKPVLSENQEIYQGVAESEDAANGLVLILKVLKVAGS